MSDLYQSEPAVARDVAEPRAAGERRPAIRATMAAGMWEPSQRQPFDPRRKSPFLAAILSVIPGVGQLYIGYYMRGFATAGSILAAIAMGASIDGVLAPVFVMSGVFIWVFNLIDAGRMAALYNHAAAGSDVIEKPQDFRLPNVGGSMLGGVALLLFGGIALSNTAFGYSLQWLEDWWPAFPVALGIYLFVRGVIDAISVRARQDRRPGNAPE